MKELPKEWLTCKISDFSHIVMGQSPISSTYNTEGTGIPFYQGKAEFGVLYPEPIKYCSAPKKIAEKGATLLSVRAPVGPTNITPHRSCIGRGLAGIHSLGGVPDRFILYLFRNYEPVLSGQGKGTTFKAITKDFLFDLNFSLPPLVEQVRILQIIEELFSDLDNAIENLEKAQEQLKVYRLAILKNAFAGKLTEIWRTKNKSVYIDRIAFPKAVVEGTEDLPEIPREWIYTSLSNTGDLSRGKSKHRPRNDPKLFGGKYPFIQTGEIRSAKSMVRTYSDTYSDIGLAQSKLWPVGTLCITIAANIAETAFLGIEACFPDSVVGFSAFETVANPKFIDFFIQSAKQKIQAYAPATAQKNINLTILENLTIPYCHLEEQRQIIQEIESRFSVCDKLEETIENSLTQAEALRQSILKQAFEGKLTEQWRKEHKELISGDNSAEALLKRIKAEKEVLNNKPKGKK